MSTRFFVAEEGTACSFKGVQEIIEKGGLFSFFYMPLSCFQYFLPNVLRSTI